MMKDEYWALNSENKVYSENGTYIGTFASKEIAGEIIDIHNLEVELNEPEPPEVVRSREETNLARLKDYKQSDPAGFQLFELIISSTQRALSLVTLKAPTIIIAEQLKTIQDRVWTLQQLHPMPEYEND
jgi:hypothetical protein